MLQSSNLIKVCKTGDKEACKAILENEDVDVNLQNKYGDTALIGAAYNGYTEIVELLLAHPEIDVNAQNAYGITALINAAENGRTGIVKVLLAHPEIDVNLQDVYGCTALIEAAEQGHTEIVKMLLAHPDIDVNTQDEYGSTALYWATKRRHTKIIKLLLAHPDVDVNLQNQRGTTALIKAAGKGHTEIVKSLLARGAHVCEIRDKFADEIKEILRNWKSYAPKSKEDQVKEIFTHTRNHLRLQGIEPMGAHYENRTHAMMKQIIIDDMVDWAIFEALRTPTERKSDLPKEVPKKTEILQTEKCGNVESDTYLGCGPVKKGESCSLANNELKQVAPEPKEVSGDKLHLVLRLTSCPKNLSNKE